MWEKLFFWLTPKDVFLYSILGNRHAQYMRIQTSVGAQLYCSAAINMKRNKNGNIKPENVQNASLHRKQYM